MDHKKIIIPLLLALAAAQPLLSMEVTAFENGRRENRVHVAVIGDGYTAGEIENLYAPAVDSLMAYMFGHPTKMIPYPRYQKFINLYRIDVISQESGVDDLEGGVDRNTALGGENGCTDFTIGICGANWDAVHDSIESAAAREGFEPDWYLVMLNDDTYNAAAHHPSRGPLPIYSAHYEGHWDMRDIAMHEAGHAWHRLADEYYYANDPQYDVYTGGEPREVNVTADPTGAKWEHWQGYQMPSGLEVGVFEGARYYETGLYRPSTSSKMNGGPDDCHWLGNDCGYNMVGVEKIIQDIYSIISPLDSHTVNSGTLVDPEVLSVTVVDSEVIMVDWLVDDSLLFSKGPLTFPVSDHLIEPGNYSVTARAWDGVIEHAFSDNSTPHELDLVRTDLENLEQSVTWEVTIEAVTSGQRAAARGQEVSVKLLADGSLYLHNPERAALIFELYNVGGVLVTRLQLTGNEQTLPIRLEKGVYHYRCLRESVSKTGRLLMMN